MNLLGISPLIKYSLSRAVQFNALFFQKFRRKFVSLNEFPNLLRG
jgi:hypothetical protein